MRFSHLVMIALIVWPGMVWAQVTQTQFETRIGQVISRFYSGDYVRTIDEGAALRAEVLDQWGADSAQVMQIDLYLLRGVLGQERFDDAGILSAELFERSHGLPRGSPLRFDIERQYGFVLNTLGRSQEAFDLLSQTAARAEALIPDDTTRIAASYLALAQVATSLQAYDVANTGYARVADQLRGRDSLVDRINYAVALADWARNLVKMRDYPEALKVYPQALVALDAAYDPLHPQRLNGERRYLEVLWITRQPDQITARLTPTFMDDVARIYGRDSLLWADFAQLKALTMVNPGPQSATFDDGLALLEETVEARAALTDQGHFLTQRARSMLAMNYVIGGRIEEALLQFLDIIDAGGTPAPGTYFAALWRARATGILSEATAIDAALRFLQDIRDSEAAAAVEALNDRLAAGSGEAAELMRDNDALRQQADGVRLALLKLGNRPAAKRDLTAEQDMRARLTLATTQITENEARIAVISPALADLAGLWRMGADEVQAELSSGEAVVVQYIVPAKSGPSFVMLITPDRLRWEALETNAEEVAARVTGIRTALGLQLGLRAAAPLTAPTRPDRDFPVADAQWLYQQTVGPIADDLVGVDHIYFDMRGPMTALPPHLLIAGQGGSTDKVDWLVRRHAITVLPSVASFGTKSLARNDHAPEPLLAFADPVFDTDAQPGPAALRGALAPLPETKDEVRAVAQAMGQGALRIGAEASEARLKRDPLARYRTLYFATHGLVAGDQLRAGALSEPALALTAGDGEDGLLKASEIAGLDLNADLVVLSACNTAVGDAPGAEALSGLARSFIYAGARSLLVSHWPVDSRSAVALMTDIFARRGGDPALSLAQAQRQAIVQMLDAPQHPDWAHPAYWAPFVVVGHAG